LLHEARPWRGSQLLCWVLMPDHLHLLVSLGEAEPLSKLMQRMKALTARQARTAHGEVWSPGFHDRALRREEDVATVARYVVMNPVRAGLVSRIGDYPYWNAIWI
jgi:REP element-mobilizing transposase RayT